MLRRRQPGNGSVRLASTQSARRQLRR
jgi:hypothetical protein